MHPGDLSPDLLVLDSVPGLSVVFHDLPRTAATLPIDQVKNHIPLFRTVAQIGQVVDDHDPGTGLDGRELDVLDDGFFIMLHADTLRINLRPEEIVGKHVPESHLPVEATSAYA